MGDAGSMRISLNALLPGPESDMEKFEKSGTTSWIDIMVALLSVNLHAQSQVSTE
jgi:hypothetical protein